MEHAAVVAVERIRRQQILREAEGYLELIGLFGEDWVPAAPIRRRLAQRSLDTLSRLAERSTPNPQTFLLRGLAFRAAEQYAEAIEPLQAAVAGDPNLIDGWLALGWCYKRSGRLELAIEALKQSLLVSPDQGIIHYNLSCYWSLAGNVSLALHHLERALALDSDFRSLAEREPDFDPIRNDPGFRSLTSVIV
jgi:tetratricopeptide (TPR) repeat protein